MTTTYPSKLTASYDSIKLGIDITRGVFTSIADLRIKLMRYIRHYDKTATPIRWTYSDPSKRMKP
jgi:hypothetical protein